MTKIYANTFEYNNKVISNLKLASDAMRNVTNFNCDIQIENDFQERERLNNYLSDCHRIENEINNILEWCNKSKAFLENMEEAYDDKARNLPVREISKRDEFNI